MNEIFVSTDVETDGPIPGPNSMLEIGSAAFLPDGSILSHFSAPIAPIEGAAPDPGTEAWWKRQHSGKYAWLLANGEPAEKVMVRYSEWVRSLPGAPTFVAYPAGFDFLFVYWYLMRFVGRSPFSFSALDIKTFAMATMKKRHLGYRGATKKAMPKEWFRPDLKHTHNALDDAIEQGHLFLSIRAANEELHSKAQAYDMRARLS